MCENKTRPLNQIVDSLYGIIQDSYVFGDEGTDFNRLVMLRECAMKIYRELCDYKRAAEASLHGPVIFKTETTDQATPLREALAEQRGASNASRSQNT